MRKLTLSALIIAALSGCGGGGSSGANPKYDISFNIYPNQAVVNGRVEFQVKEENGSQIPKLFIDTDAEFDSDKDGKPDNDADLFYEKTFKVNLTTIYSEPGSYRAILYVQDSVGNILANNTQTVQIIVKPNDFFTEVNEIIPADFTYVKKSDFDAYIKPYIDLLYQTFISDLEQIIISNLINGDLIDGFGFKQDSLIVGINSPNSRFNDSDSDGQKDYSGSLDSRLIDPSAVKNIYDFLTAKASDNQLMDISSAASTNNSSISRNSPMVLFNYGTILCQQAVSYTLNGNQINIGVVLDTTTSPLIQQDKDVIAAFNRDYRDKGNYIPLSVVVLKESSLYNGVKAIVAEIEYHAVNNP